MNSKLTSLILLTAALFFLPLLSHAQYTWVGLSPLNSNFDNGENWLDAVSNPVAPPGGGYQSLYFGAANRYDPEVNGSDYRIQYLQITADAGAAYVIRGGDALRMTSGPFTSSPAPIIVNDSAYRLTIEVPLEFVRINNSGVAGGNSSVIFDTGDAGILWSGGSFMTSSGSAAINKYGFGTLQLQGTHTTAFPVHLYEGELLLDTAEPLDIAELGTISFYGAQLRVLGDTDAASAQTFALKGVAYSVAGSGNRRINTIVVDPVSAAHRLTLSFTTMSLAGAYAGGFHYDLSKAGAGVHYEALTSVSWSGNVVSWATVTDSTGTTGFVQMVANDGGGYDVARYTGYTLLGTSVNNAGTGWSGTSHYYVDGNHTLTGTGEYRGLVGVSPSPRLSGTLTLKGTGTLSLVDYHLRASYILLEEGTDDYTISGLGLAARGGSWSANEMRLFQQRTNGRLIIDTDYLGVITNMPTSGTPTAAEGATNPADIPVNITTSSMLFKAGPGTVVLKSPNSNIIGGAYVQEGRLQLESTTLGVVSRVDVYDGTLGGSGQIGGGIKWVWDGENTANVADGIRYTPVTIGHGGTIDVTPSDDNTDSLLRGLHVTGSLIMEEGSTLAMEMSSDVIAGSYISLRVFAEDIEDTAVWLAGDLSLVLQAPVEQISLITLLATDGLIDGVFSSINGNAFGENNHFILSYGGVDYDFSLYYDYNLGGGLTGVVLHAIPEPATVTLLAGLALTGVVWLRRRRR